MADDSRIEQSYPRLIFEDGTIAILFRIETMVGTDEIMCSMCLFEWAKRQNKIKPEDLDFSEPNPLASTMGVFKRKYKKHYMINKSDNPEFPIKSMTCDFNGNYLNVTNSEHLQLIIDSQSSQIKTLFIQNHELRRKLEDMAIGRAAEKRQQDRIYGFSKEEFLNSPFFQTARLQEGKELDK
jgi:hypothetical protein